MAVNIGEQPQMLQAWGAAVERMGGKTRGRNRVAH